MQVKSRDKRKKVPQNRGILALSTYYTTFRLVMQK